MTVFSIRERIEEWVTDQLAKEDPLGADEWGHQVTMAAVQTPQGDAIVWIILLTIRSPWLGQDALGSVTKLAANIPPEGAVRMGITRGAEGLRKAFEIKKREGLPQGNGHDQAGLPPGLTGKEARMTTPVAQLHATTDLVAVSWLRTAPGLVADGVASQLPADETTWAANGFVVVPTNVGGSPHSTMPLHRPVVQVECWGTVPGSDKLPWNIPDQLAAQIFAATQDRTTCGRPLAITANGVTYPGARVLSAKMLTEPRRIWHDTGDYAGRTFDLALQWVGSGEEIP